jgi:hypothetical protein
MTAFIVMLPLSELWLQRFFSVLGLFWLFLIVKMEISLINSCERNFSGCGDFFLWGFMDIFKLKIHQRHIISETSESFLFEIFLSAKGGGIN